MTTISFFVFICGYTLINQAHSKDHIFAFSVKSSLLKMLAIPTFHAYNIYLFFLSAHSDFDKERATKFY